MYCPSCGKQIPENSKFCMNCGNEIGTSHAVSLPKVGGNAGVLPLDYQYEDVKWEPQKGQKYLDWVGQGIPGTTPVLSVPAIRIHFWQNAQHWLLPQIREWQDAGWEAVTEIGPACTIIDRVYPGMPLINVSAFFSGASWYCMAIVIKMRRGKYYERGREHFFIGNYAGALADFLWETKHGREVSLAHHALSCCGLQDYQSALLYINRALESEKDDLTCASIVFWRGIINLANGNIKDSSDDIGWASRTSESLPESTLRTRLKARLFLFEGDLQKAQDLYMAFFSDKATAQDAPMWEIASLGAVESIFPPSHVMHELKKWLQSRYAHI